jgi:hypothetical protein
MELHRNLVLFFQSLPGLAWGLIGAGVFLALLGARASDGEGGWRGWVAERGEALVQCSWIRLPGVIGDQLAVGASRLVAYWFGQSERNIMAGGLFLFLIIVAIPIASFLNFTRGGSAFLLTAIGVIVAFVLGLMALGEGRGFGWLKGLLAIGLFAGIFLFVPGYVLVSLSDRLLHQPGAQAAIGAILVLPLVYIVSNSLAMLVQASAPFDDENPPIQRYATLFLAALPPAYLLSFLTFWTGVPSPVGWPALLNGLLANGLSLAWTVGLLSLCRRWPGAGWLAALVLAAGGGHVFSLGLGPGIGAGPMVPFLLVVLVLYLAGFGKLAFGGAARLAGPNASVRHPLVAAGAALIAGGALLGAASGLS